MTTEKSTNASLRNNTVWIELPEFELLCFNLARELLGKFEPIPDFVTRFPGVLESCLETPKQTFGDMLLYPTLTDQASIFFYLLVKNHPFQNGNKRIALTTLFVFLALNKKWLKVTDLDLYNLAVEVANSKPKEKTKVLKFVRNILKENLIQFPKTRKS